MKSLKDHLQTTDEGLLATLTLGPVLACLIGVGTFGSPSDFKDFNFIEIIQDWWMNSKTSNLIRNLMNDTDINSLKSKPKYMQNKMLFNVLQQKLSQDDLDILAKQTGNKIKAEI